MVLSDGEGAQRPVERSPGPRYFTLINKKLAVVNPNAWHLRYKKSIKTVTVKCMYRFKHLMLCL